MGVWTGRALGSLLAGAALVLAAPSWADPKDDARDLARQAFEHLDKEEFREAARAAEEAEAKYHAPVHLRLIGEAYEGLGRRADAAEVYDRLVAEPLPATAHQVFRDAQDFAKERLEELSAILPAIRVKVEGIAAADATVTLNGEEIEPTVARRMDPGSYTVRVTAPEHEPFEEKIELPEHGGVVTVVAPLHERFVAPAEPQDEELPIGPIALMAGGGALFLIGVITGGASLAAAGDLEDRCPNKQCTPADEDDFDAAVALGWTSTVMLPLGLFTAGGGVAWLLLGSSGEKDSADATGTVRPLLGPGFVGVRGSF